MDDQEQFNIIETVLMSCMNWQECALLIKESNSSIHKQVGFKQARKTWEKAAMKLNFLQDALIYSLRNHVLRYLHPEKFPLDEMRDTFEFYDELQNWLMMDAGLPEEKRIEIYFYGLAIAKLFRARMATRCGGAHGLAWGKNFTYPIHVVRRPKTWLERLSEAKKLAKEKEAEKDLVRFRKDVFSDKGRQQSDAITLAEELLGSARTFVNLYDQGIRNHVQRGALRDAICGNNLDREGLKGLLKAWSKGVAYEYGPLPMDRLWERSADCAYAENCIEYDEFTAITIKNEADLDDCNARRALERAKKKLGVLNEEEARWQPPDRQERKKWIDVAKNWWCRGFRSGIYRWRPNCTVNGSLSQDAGKLVNLVNGKDLYEKVLRRFGDDEIDVAREIVRVACEGGDLSGILRRVETTLPKLYAVLFLVASKAKSPKLQDCWAQSRPRRA